LVGSGLWHVTCSKINFFIFLQIENCLNEVDQ
jgi:hypothetical protein